MNPLLPRAAAIGGVLLVVTASSGWTQTGNQSDITGVNTTSSTIAAFTPGGAALGTAGAQVTTQLTLGTLTSSAGAPIPPAVQTMLAGVLNGTVAPPPDLASTLGASAGAPLGQALVTALQGLLVNPDPGQLTEAVEAYNEVVDNSAQSFLTSPPPEFTAIQAILDQLVRATG